MTDTVWMNTADVLREMRFKKSTFYRYQNDDSRPTLLPIPNLGGMVRYRREDFEVYRRMIEGTMVGLVGGPKGGPEINEK